MNISKADMMNVVSAAADAAATRATRKAAATATTGDTAPTAPQRKEADRDTFLTLLVAQLKNQDPLAPQDSTQFVAQLAQFNSLDQLISINQRLGRVLDEK